MSMEALWSFANHTYHLYNYEWADPRTNHLPFIARPFTIGGVALAYIGIAMKVGPALMRDRKPFDLRWVMIVYNIAQIVFNLVLLRPAVRDWTYEYNWRCQPIDWSTSPKAVHVTRLVYCYFLLKVFDLVDTLMFVLRKKQRQITRLHVFHHCGMLLTAWHGTKFYPGGHTTFLGLVNTFVHVVMYFYYLLTAANIQAAWWKKYLTQLQMVQHFLIAVHAGQLFISNPCGHPLFPAVFLVPMAVALIHEFGQFYVSAYWTHGPAADARAERKDI